MRGHPDLERVSLAAIVCALVAGLVPWEIVRVAAAVPLTLFLPGYAVVAAAFASRELAPPKRLVLSVGVSLMVLVLSTFFLNIPSFGIRTASWAVLLPLIVLAACRLAALRRDAPRRRRGRPLFATRPRTRDVVLVSLAALIGGAAVVLAQKPLPAENAAGYAALWMLPSDSREESVVIGVISNEHDPAAYSLEVELGDEGRSQTYEVELDPGEEETFELDVPSAAAGSTRVVASLYKEEKPGHLYRRVNSWLPRQKTFP